MKAVVQRVKKAKVSVNNKIISQIGRGFLVFLGIAQNDTEKQVDWLANKIVNLRIMSDEKGKMNKSLKETNGQLLIVSQFTLYGDCRKGNRPSFTQAADPVKAEKLYNLFIKKVKSLEVKVKSGIFGAMMEIELINDGPVTIIVDRQ